MAFSFERPIGAAADARELEYIAALHQTRHDDLDTFVDGSIEATDVKNYLLSRYGIKVTKEEVRKLIFYDLAGGDSHDDCIDITEVVVILIIPYLVKVAFINENFFGDQSRFSTSHVSAFEQEALSHLNRIRAETDESIISDVLRIIMSDVTGSEDPQPLTKGLLRRIFEEYGESDLIEDDALLDEMIEMASDGTRGAMLDSDAFVRGLTNDIKLYDPINESKFTTHYEDVFGMVTSAKKKETGTDDEEEDVDDATEIGQANVNEKEVRNVERIFTFPQIDFLADSFRDKTQYMLAWIAVIFFYITYANPNNSYGIEVCGVDSRETFSCKTGKSILVWLVIMGLMIGVMAPHLLYLARRTMFIGTPC